MLEPSPHDRFRHYPPRLFRHYADLLNAEPGEAESAALLKLGGSILVYLDELAHADAEEALASKPDDEELRAILSETALGPNPSLGGRLERLVKLRRALRSRGLDPIVRLDLDQKLARTQAAAFVAFWKALIERLTLHPAAMRHLVFADLTHAPKVRRVARRELLDAFVHMRNLHAHAVDVRIGGRPIDFAPTASYHSTVHPMLRRALEELLEDLRETVDGATAVRTTAVVERDGRRVVRGALLAGPTETPIDVPDPDRRLAENQHWLLDAKTRSPRIRVRPEAVVTAFSVGGDAEDPPRDGRGIRRRSAHPRGAILTAGAIALFALAAAWLSHGLDQSQGRDDDRVDLATPAPSLTIDLYPNELATEPIRAAAPPLVEGQRYTLRIEGLARCSFLVAFRDTGGAAAVDAWPRATLETSFGWRSTTDREGTETLAGTWRAAGASSETLLVIAGTSGLDVETLRRSIESAVSIGCSIQRGGQLAWSRRDVTLEIDPSAESVVDASPPAWARAVARAIEIALAADAGAAVSGRTYHVGR